MYAKFFKRIIDFLLSLTAILLLSPILIIFSIIGIFAMRGNPYYVQDRVGKNDKVFKLIKFRTMNCRKDKEGKLLPDVQRLTKYGKFLRNTSIDELMELFNILFGQMSIVGPRPLLVKYLPLYNKRQRRRHEVKPGLTGYAQVHGRNAVTWEERFEMDVKYVENISFINDLKIFFGTFTAVFKREGIDSQSTVKYTMQEFQGTKEEE